MKPWKLRSLAAKAEVKRALGCPKGRMHESSRRTGAGLGAPRYPLCCAAPPPPLRRWLSAPCSAILMQLPSLAPFIVGHPVFVQCGDPSIPSPALDSFPDFYDTDDLS